MLVGCVDGCTPTFINGWAADTDAPEAVISVVVYVDGERLLTVACDRERPDLVARADLRGNLRHGFRCDLSPPLDFGRIGRISVRFARSGELLTDGARAGQRRPSLSPILVTAPGRSGTTLLMNRLSQSPRICVVELLPFEMRLLAYWSGVYRTLTAGADFERSTHPDLPTGTGFRIGSNPYSHQTYAGAFRARSLATEYFDRFVPNITEDFIRHTIGEYYMRLQTDQGKHEAVYFAEKANSLDPQSREASCIFYPELKEIIVLRDPRDLFCSHIAYFRRGPNNAFSEIISSSSDLLKIWRNATDRQFFVKYEDMISGGGDVFRKLSEFLGVPDLEHGNSAMESAVFQVHATSKSPKDSVGRWRELPAEDIRRCNAVWGEFLDQFGYER